MAQKTSDYCLLMALMRVFDDHFVVSIKLFNARKLITEITKFDQLYIQSNSIRYIKPIYDVEI